MTVLKRLGVVLLVVGALILAAQSSGFTTSAADRGVNVNAAAPENAFLGLHDDGYAGGEIRNYECVWFFCYTDEQPQEVVTVHNQFDQNVTVTEATVDGGTGDLFEVRSTPETLAPDGSDTIELGCTGDVEESGQTDVTVRVSAEGDSVAVDGAAVTAENVQYDCRSN
ncbi:hypothetical protein [Halostella sp. PRR32]|uniref:hypothetical protein n=1 Tax=Halostella sp. PRR32 TaxID=3098147 RepID=UPI002B1DD590|nr:hypothetical protein [Halostella sp. PRR32]